ncbi:hypothetical protein D3C71_2162510 [compost metagenome]
MVSIAVIVVPGPEPVMASRLNPAAPWMIVAPFKVTTPPFSAEMAWPDMPVLRIVRFFALTSDPAPVTYTP